MAKRDRAQRQAERAALAIANAVAVLRPRATRQSVVRRIRRAVRRVPSRFNLAIQPTVTDTLNVTLTPVGRGAAQVSQQAVIDAVVQAVTQAPVQRAAAPSTPGVTVPPPPAGGAVPLSVPVPRYVRRGPQLQVVSNIERNPLTEFGIRGLCETLNNRIIQMFARQETYAGKLRPNSVRWEKYKAERGLDLRRGHATLQMAQAIRRTKFYTVRWSTNRVEIVWSDAALIAAVPYAEYYIAEKCIGGKLTGVKRSDWDAAILALGVR